MNVCYFMKTTPFCMINILKMIFRYTITQIPHILVLTVHRIIILLYSGTYIYRTSNENILVKCDTYVVRFYMYLIPQIYFLLLFISQNILHRITFIDSKKYPRFI